MPAPSPNSNSPEADFHLDLDQVFERPAPPAGGGTANQPHHFKLEKKAQRQVPKFSRFTKPGPTGGPPPKPQSPPVAPDEVAARGLPKRDLRDRPLELAPNRTYEVMRASSLFESEELIDPHSFNKGLRIFGLVLMAFVGTMLSIKLVKSSTNLVEEKALVVDPQWAQAAQLKSAQAALQAYLGAKTWNEKLAWILDAERLTPIFRSYYEDQKGTDPKVSILGDGLPRENGGQYWFTFELEEAITRNQITARLQETPHGYRLDWENFIGLGAMRWDRFLSERPTEPTAMRVSIAPSETFSGRYADAKKYQAYEVRQQVGTTNLLGYVERSSRAGQTLQQAVAGQPRPTKMHLYLQFEPEAAPGQVKIIDIVATAER